MSGVLWYGTCLLGSLIWCLAHPSSAFLNSAELVAAAVVIGTVLPAYCTYLAAAAISSLGPQSLIISNGAMIVAVLAAVPRFRANLRARMAAGMGADKMNVLLSLGITAMAAILFIPLYSSRMIPTVDGNIMSGGSCWADMPIHMHIVQSFIVGRNQDVSWGGMHSPVFAGELMYYPFIPDWHAAVMVRLGSSMRDGFLYPGLAMQFAFWVLLFHFTVRLTKSRLGAIFSLMLTAGAGGMGGIDLTLKRGFNAAMNEDMIQNDSTGNGKIFWFAFLPHVLLPQRGANFAYPLVLLVLLFVWKATDATQPMRHIARRELLVAAAAMAAMLPLVQAHAFIGVGIIIAVYAALDVHKWIAQPQLMFSWLYAGVTAVVLAAPQMALFRKQVESGHEGSFMKFGWIYQAHDYGRAEGVWALLPIVGGFFRFWWMSLGPALPLFLIALVLMGWDVMLASAHAALNADHTLTSAVAAAEVYLPDNEDANASTATTARAVRPGVRSRVRGLQCADDTSLGEHLWLLFVSHLPEAVQQVVMGERSLAITSLDHVYMGINRATITGRGADTMKMALGAFLVFMVGNYINFQPWDRDNCKLFYLWVFVYSAVVGAMLAAPLEFFLHQGPGFARILQWTGVLPSTTIPLTQQLEVGAAPTTSPAATRVSAGVSVSAPRMLLARSVGLTTFLSVPVLLTVLVFSGFMSIRREYTMNHVLLDRDQQLIGEWIAHNTPPKSVFVHKDGHIVPSGSLAGRPTLLGYVGWMWSHGYNYHERHRDREAIMANALKDSDQHAYNLMRRWGVRYVLGENMHRHHRPSEDAYRQALAEKAAQPDNPDLYVPHFDPDMYLDGMLKRVASAGRFEVFEVLGYNSIPN